MPLDVLKTSSVGKGDRPHYLSARVLLTPENVVCPLFVRFVEVCLKTRIQSRERGFSPAG